VFARSSFIEGGQVNPTERLLRTAAARTSDGRVILSASHPCYAAAMINDLVTALLVTSAAVIGTELLVKLWEFF
jgi:hypothetical protein